MNTATAQSAIQKLRMELLNASKAVPLASKQTDTRSERSEQYVPANAVGKSNTEYKSQTLGLGLLGEVYDSTS